MPAADGSLGLLPRSSALEANNDSSPLKRSDGVLGFGVDFRQCVSPLQCQVESGLTQPLTQLLLDHIKEAADRIALITKVPKLFARCRRASIFPRQEEKNLSHATPPR